MSDLGELYAACIVEYASAKENGLLAGGYSIFVKDARDAFNLPYDKQLFEEAFKKLEDMGVLTKYETKGVPMRYSVRRSAFDNAMVMEGNQLRRYESVVNASAASHAAASSTNFGGQRRKPTLLESYADLGSSRLSELLEAFEPELAQIGTAGEGGETALDEPMLAVEHDEALPLAAVEIDHSIIESTDWTGLSRRISQSDLQNISSKIVELNVAIVQSDADERTKINAIKRVNAVQSLLEAPDVPWRDVIAILSSPSLASFLTVLTTIQFILGFAN